MQNVLVEDPERGDVIKGGGGIRKLRHALPGRGKSGGVRVIYYWPKDDCLVYLLVVYPKSRKDNLTDKPGVEAGSTGIFRLRLQTFSAPCCRRRFRLAG